MDKKDTNPKDRVATTRLDLSLFPATARAYGALAMTEGDLKYGGYNYRSAGVQASVYYAAANRHLDKWYNGEWADEKTNVPHLASALACIGVLIDAIECDKMNDDRPPKCNMAGLLTDMENRVAHLQELFKNGPDRYTETNNGECPVLPPNVLDQNEIIADVPLRSESIDRGKTGKDVCDREIPDPFERPTQERYG